MWSPSSHPLKPQAPASAASTAHSCDPELTPDEQNASKVMLRCPYSKDHVFREEYMVKHALECRKAHIVFLREQGLALKVFACKHNPEHEIPRLELYIHEEYLCPDRPAILRTNPAPSRTLTLTEALPVTNTYFPPDVVAAVGDGQASARNGSESTEDAKPSTSFSRFRKSLPRASALDSDSDSEPKPFTYFSKFRRSRPPPPDSDSDTDPKPSTSFSKYRKSLPPSKGSKDLTQFPANLTEAEGKQWKEESVKKAEEASEPKPMEEASEPTGEDEKKPSEPEPTRKYDISKFCCSPSEEEESSSEEEMSPEEREQAEMIKKAWCLKLKHELRLWKYELDESDSEEEEEAPEEEEEYEEESEEERDHGTMMDLN